MKKIALFGGTFNPIHNGHLHLAKQFSKQMQFDQLYFMPSKAPPHKIITCEAPPEDRYQMCRLAVEDTPFLVSDLEIKRDEASYTVFTLETFQKMFPEDQLHLIVGEDMFLTLASWYQVERIFELATICTSPHNYSGLKRLREHAETFKRMGAKTVICGIECLPISSTMVREGIGTGKDISSLVPEKVLHYMIEKQLYKECSTYGNKEI